MKKFLTTSLHYTSVFTTLRPDKTPWQANYHETILRILISKLKYRSNARFQSCASQHPSSFHFAETGQSSFHFSLFCQLADTPRQDALAGELSRNNLRILISKLKYRSNARFQSCASQHPSSFHFAVTGQSSFHFSLFCQLADTPRQDALAGRPTQSGLILADKELILLIINDRNVKKGWVQVYPATILHTSRLKPYSS